MLGCIAIFCTKNIALNGLELLKIFASVWKFRTFFCSQEGSSFVGKHKYIHTCCAIHSYTHTKCTLHMKTKNCLERILGCQIWQQIFSWLSELLHVLWCFASPTTWTTIVSYWIRTPVISLNLSKLNLRVELLWRSEFRELFHSVYKLIWMCIHNMFSSYQFKCNLRIMVSFLMYINSCIQILHVYKFSDIYLVWSTRIYK